MSDIKIIKMVLEVTGDEARDIGNHIKRSLKSSIDSHYCRFENRVFEEQCRKDLNLMKQLLFIGYGYDGEQWEDELWSYLEDKRKSLKKDNES